MRDIPEDLQLNILRRENLESRIWNPLSDGITGYESVSAISILTTSHLLSVNDNLLILVSYRTLTQYTEDSLC